MIVHGRIQYHKNAPFKLNGLVVMGARENSVGSNTPMLRIGIVPDNTGKKNKSPLIEASINKRVMARAAFSKEEFRN